MKNRFIQFGKDSAVYGIGGVLSRALSFLMLPVYTRIFSVEDFGTIEMLSVLNGLLASVVVLGMDSAQSYFFFSIKDEGGTRHSELISAIFLWKILWGSMAVMIAMALSPVLNDNFFQGRLSTAFFLISFAGVLAGQLMYQSVDLYRLTYRPWAFVGINIGSNVVAAIIVVILTLHFHVGIISFFWGSLAGFVMFGAVGWFGLRSYFNFTSLHQEWWPRLIRFGVPLLPTGLSMWVMSTTDRWFINYYGSMEAVGIYAVGAKFAVIIVFAIEIFRQAWWPIALDAMHSPDGPQFFRIIARYYFGLTMSGLVLLAVFSPLLLRMFTTSQYHNAYPVVSILAYSSAFYGFILISGAGVWKAEKTWWSTIALSVGAICNVALNIALVPKLGGIGAAAATSLSMLLSNIILLIVSERYWDMRVPRLIIVMQFIVSLAVVVGVIGLYQSSLSIVLPVVLGSSGIGLILSITVGPHHARKAFAAIRAGDFLSLLFASVTTKGTDHEK